MNFIEDFDNIITSNWSRQQRSYFSGYFDSGIEHAMLMKEVLTKTAYAPDDQVPQLTETIALFQREFCSIMEITFSVSEKRHFTDSFSLADQTITDNT